MVAKAWGCIWSRKRRIATRFRDPSAFKLSHYRGPCKPGSDRTSGPPGKFECAAQARSVRRSELYLDVLIVADRAGQRFVGVFQNGAAVQANPFLTQVLPRALRP